MIRVVERSVKTFEKFEIGETVEHYGHVQVREYYVERESIESLEKETLERIVITLTFSSVKPLACLSYIYYRYSDYARRYYGVVCAFFDKLVVITAHGELSKREISLLESCHTAVRYYMSENVRRDIRVGIVEDFEDYVERAILKVVKYADICNKIGPAVASIV